MYCVPRRRGSALGFVREQGVVRNFNHFSTVVTCTKIIAADKIFKQERKLLLFRLRRTQRRHVVLKMVEYQIIVFLFANGIKRNLFSLVAFRGYFYGPL